MLGSGVGLPPTFSSKKRKLPQSRNVALGKVFGGLKPKKPPVLPGEINTLVYEKITSDDSMVVVWRPHYQESKEVINMEKMK